MVVSVVKFLSACVSGSQLSLWMRYRSSSCFNIQGHIACGSVFSHNGRCYAACTSWLIKSECFRMRDSTHLKVKEAHSDDEGDEDEEPVIVTPIPALLQQNTTNG